ncbi:MAG: serine/threonine-protein kinase, partial [Pseudomonadota bacterium]
MILKNGTELGKYRIIRQIGQGGMALVFEAEDVELGRRVALKLLPPTLALDPERVARFMKEVRNSAALSHPHIVPVYDVGEGDGFHFYTMALLPGGDLKERIRTGLTPQASLAVLKSLADALGTAHAKGIVHRDVKPENVMFDERDRPVLTDLGIARAMGSGTRMTKTGMSIGTPHYMSPEQIKGMDVDGRSDIYSLGILLYEMLTGQVPYDAPETLAVSYKHVNDPIPVLPQAHARLQPLVNAMLGKEPEHRYPDCASLIRDVELVEQGKKPAGAGGKGSATRVLARPGASAGASGNSAVKAGVIGALAALLLVGGVFWFMNRDEAPVARGGGGFVASGPAAPAPVPAPAPTAPQASPAPSPAAPVVAQESLGGLKLTSEPSGAAVYVDGARRGATPLSLQDMRAGAYEVELRLAEHETEGLTLRVEAGKTASRHVALSYDPALMRSLTVQADPSDAVVKILNITPRYAPGMRLKPGRYNVQVSRDGYEPVTQWVELGSQDVVVPVSLVASAHALTVRTTPPDATVSLEDPHRPFTQGMKLS